MSKEKQSDTKELALIVQLEEAAVSVPVENITEAQAFSAVDLILKVRKKFVEIDEKRKERTAPASETIKLINEDYKKFLNPLKEVEDRLRTALEGYASRRIKEDTEKLALLRAETGDKSLVIPIGIKSIPSNGGDVRFRKGFAVTVSDESKVPKKYKKTVIDVKAIQADVDAADGLLKVPGVDISQVASAAIYVS